MSSTPIGPVLVAHSKVTSKLNTIAGLRSQKTASHLTEEQSALQVLIDVRSTEVQALVNDYTTAVTTFVGSFTPTPTPTG